jgi:hypothetical protein
MLEMPSLTCRHFELTDVRGGESFSRFPVQPGDLLVGDRGYAGIAAVKSVQEKGGDVIVRIRPHSRGMHTPDGEMFDLLSQVADMTEGEERSWPVSLSTKDSVKISGQVCVYRLDAKSADAALRKAKHESSRKQHVIRPETIDSCKYVVLFTTLSQDELSLEDVL